MNGTSPVEVNAEFFTGKSEDIVVQYYEEHNGLTADAIIVDPPRKGCDPTLLDMIAKIAPKKLVYVSCDSATLARDIAILKEQGFELIKAKCFDNFPGSVHVETVCLLSNTRQATTTPDVET